MNELFINEIIEFENYTFFFKCDIFNSEFKIITTLKNPTFILENKNSLSNNLKLIAIQVDDFKYSCKIINPKPELYILRILSENKTIKINFSIEL